jgi:hypothetical protein
MAIGGRFKRNYSPQANGRDARADGLTPERKLRKKIPFPLRRRCRRVVAVENQ